MRRAARRMVGKLTKMGWSAAVPPGIIARNALEQLGRTGFVPLPQAARPKPKVYGRVGDLEVRLANTRGDIKRAQRLRYQVFYEEMAAKPTFTAQMRRRDEDPYDAICDHLTVVDLARHSIAGDGWNAQRKPKVVGTYRVLRQDVAERGLGFYTQGEYDIAPLIKRKPELRFVELGRSCVLKPYRTKRTVELLWHGLWTYVREHKADVMIGCASFPGTDPEAHAMALSYLYHHSMAPGEWRCRAHSQFHTSMNLLPREKVDMRAALKGMPPLIKAYLRVGAWVGDGAVVDHQFGTTDVMIILPVANIDPRYFEHYGAPDEVKSRIAVEG